MMFHQRRRPNSGVDIQQLVATLEEEINPALFFRSWEDAARTHPALRTEFRSERVGETQQRILDRVEFETSEYDCSALSHVERQRRLARFLRKDRRRGFDLAGAPLCRFALFRFGGEDYRFVWTFPHIVLDGGSFRTVVHDVFAAYEARLQGRIPALHAPRPFADYVAWLGKELERKRPKALIFFREVLAGFARKNEILRAPKHPGTALNDRLQVERSFRLSECLTNRLRKLALAHGVTLNACVQAAWALIVSDFSGRNDALFGVLHAARRNTLPEAGRMVGLFINTLPLRVVIDPELTTAQFLCEVARRHKALAEFEHTSLVDIQSVAEVPTGEAQFDSVVVFNAEEFGAALARREPTWSHRRFAWIEQTNYPLALFADAEKELSLNLVSDVEAVDDFTAQAMEHRIIGTLEAFARQPNSKLAAMDRVGESERELLLRKVNATSASFAAEFCAHEFFEEQVQKTPDAIAIVFGQESISYRELNERANHVAAKLQVHGVGADPPVGLYLERSLEMMIALLGVVKAGGAYVPLDPGYPAERVLTMVVDNQVTVVLSQKHLRSKLPSLDATVLGLE